jgi:hypothetical protein
MKKTFLALLPHLLFLKKEAEKAGKTYKNML